MHNANGYFITGTDTNVGKTFVTLCLAHLLNRLKPKHFVSSQRWLKIYKPIETGVEEWGYPPDAYSYLQQLELDQSLSDINTYAFQPPVSPNLAAEQEEITISLDRIHAHANQLAQSATWILVEGAGGILVPINQQQTMADIIAVLDLPVILVSENRLGTINQVLLSIAYLTQRGIPIQGIVLNDCSGEVQPAKAENKRIIEQFTAVPVLAEIPYFHHSNSISALLDSLEAQGLAQQLFQTD
jgi:dethiobiotin synthetase